MTFPLLGRKTSSEVVECTTIDDAQSTSRGTPVFGEIKVGLYSIPQAVCLRGACACVRACVWRHKTSRAMTRYICFSVEGVECRISLAC